ncbi:histidine kinase [Nonomuraea sp. ZG12]|uniref:histidine kinase n=1 Tax=Nonomuraea sp. ZG12 TaxID=3452207 RepID=UPI003F896BE7
METQHTRGRDRRRALSRLTRLGDVPVVVMLAWAGWLAVPWSFSGLAQARAAAAAAADAVPPPARSAEESVRHPQSVRHPLADATPAKAWGIPAPEAQRLTVSAGSDQQTRTSPADDQDTQVRPTGIEPGTRTDPSGIGQSAQVPLAEVGADVRARLAGEVHDAAGHGLAAIAMQAGLALVALDDDPEQARESLQAIRQTSLTTLTQLRAALDRLDPHDPADPRAPTDPRHLSDQRGAGDPGDPKDPAPGAVEDLSGLIAGVRAAGLPVDVEPASPVVPAHLRGTVYRVVRESLTNVLRHAGPTRALVRVANDPCEFVLEVADRGVGWSGAADGRGLTGMRAGVTGAGGLFAAGPREGGGFQVVARFPQDPT